MSGFNTMGHPGNGVGGAMAPITPIATATMPMTHATIPNGSCLQQRDPSVSSYSCMSRSSGYDIPLSPYNRHGSMGVGLGNNPMGPTGTSVAMASATHSYHQTMNGQYGAHNSHNSTGITISQLIGI